MSEIEFNQGEYRFLTATLTAQTGQISITGQPTFVSYKLNGNTVQTVQNVTNYVAGPASSVTVTWPVDCSLAIGGVIYYVTIPVSDSNGNSATVIVKQVVSIQPVP
jgi:hypothetical protein